mmetsp:Transcript_7020/g.10769  ORF Transcript_7020/g.10769 Transcript_7020/m.10769 type:complete len:95 (-) Transcript_7020:380-664(-)
MQNCNSSVPVTFLNLFSTCYLNGNSNLLTVKVLYKTNFRNGMVSKFYLSCDAVQRSPLAKSPFSSKISLRRQPVPQLLLITSKNFWVASFSNDE